MPGTPAVYHGPFGPRISLPAASPWYAATFLALGPRLSLVSRGANAAELTFSREADAITKSSDVLECSPEVQGGVPVFRGTRVPVSTLLDYLEGGDRLSEFLDEFPTVKREQAEAVLELAKGLIARDGREAASG